MSDNQCWLNPGKGYRFLQNGEIINHGDECWDGFSCEWVKSRKVGSRAGKADTDYVYRRKTRDDCAGFAVANVGLLDGYQRLSAGTVIREGDEILDTLGRWHPALPSTVGMLVERGDVIRRKAEKPKAEEPKATIDPGEGYRLLVKGEELRADDECWQSTGEGWLKTSYSGKRVGEKFTDCIYRRKVEEPAKTEAVGPVSFGLDGKYFAEADFVTVAEAAKPSRGKVYVAGPMRGRKLYNFPEFDRVGGLLLNAGYEVASPADLDRAHGFDPWELPEGHDWSTVPTGFDLKAAFHRDIQAVADCTHILLLDGWTASVGARCEYFAARWLGLKFLVEMDGQIIELGPGWEPVCPVEEPPKAYPWSIATAKIEMLAQEAQDLISRLGSRAKPVESILDEAKRITGGDRQAQYGPPDQDFRRTADMWTGLFGDLLKDGARFEPKDVAKAMILLKLSRLMHSAKRDSVVDIAGYAHCLAVCYEESGGFTS